MKPAVLLLSGGLDSTTLLAQAIADGYDVHPLSFRYGQRHSGEIDGARSIAARYGVERHHRVVDLDPSMFSASALTGASAVPKDRDVEHGTDIPATYVPARNTIFLAYALGVAEVIGAADIFIGVNAVDYSGYPDCRPEFIDAFQGMARLATRAGVEGTGPVTIRTPLMHFDKSKIISLGVSLGVDYGLTTSCYDPAPNGGACGHCDACILRRRGFASAGVPDPTRYV